MKTAFALALLAVNAQAAITGVVGEWKSKKHVDVGELQVCAQHGTAVSSSATNTITYTYAGATCTTGTTAAELKWGSGATDVTTAEGTLAAKSTCVIDDTAKTVVCNTVVVTQNHFSCVRLMKCRPTTQESAAGTFKVKQFETDNTDVVSGAATKFGANKNTVTINKPTAAEAKVGAAEFTMELKLTAAVAIASGQAVTIVAPGYKFASGSVCTLNSGAATASSADSTNSITFKTTAASTTGEVDLKCTKVTAVTATPAGKLAVISGGTDVSALTTVTNAGFVNSLEIAAATTTTTTTKAPTGSASTTSLSAAALLLAASMYL
jgi:hypothetical protein